MEALGYMRLRLGTACTIAGQLLLRAGGEAGEDMRRVCQREEQRAQPSPALWLPQGCEVVRPRLCQQLSCSAASSAPRSLARLLIRCAAGGARRLLGH